MRREDSVTRDVLRRIEILREQRGRHHQRRACIRKTFASGAIDREFLRWIERLDAGQIAQRVGVFHVRQPPQHDGAGIAGIREGDLIQSASHPVRELLFFLGGELLFLLRRHFAHLDLLQHIFPDVRLFLNVGGFEIEVAFLFFSGVAVEAVGLKEGSRFDGASG